MALGQIAFFGSGETSLAGGRIFESLARKIKDPTSHRIDGNTGRLRIEFGAGCGACRRFYEDSSAKL